MATFFKRFLFWVFDILTFIPPWLLTREDWATMSGFEDFFETAFMMLIFAYFFCILNMIISVIFNFFHEFHDYRSVGSFFVGLLVAPYTVLKHIVVHFKAMFSGDRWEGALAGQETRKRNIPSAGGMFIRRLISWVFDVLTVVVYCAVLKPQIEKPIGDDLFTPLLIVVFIAYMFSAINMIIGVIFNFFHEFDDYESVGDFFEKLVLAPLWVVVHLFSHFVAIFRNEYADIERLDQRSERSRQNAMETIRLGNLYRAIDRLLWDKRDLEYDNPYVNSSVQYDVKIEPDKKRIDVKIKVSLTTSCIPLSDIKKSYSYQSAIENLKKVAEKNVEYAYNVAKNQEAQDYQKGEIDSRIFDGYYSICVSTPEVSYRKNT